MRLSDKYFFTLREDVKDEDSLSGNLLCKAGYIKKTSAGIYMMLPLGLKVEEKIEAIIRKNMNETGAQEVKMPALIAQEYYEKSGRLENFGKSIYKLRDRSNKAFTLGPTHEELFAVAAKMMIKSYKNMPFNLYQIQSKYRDEPRARFGLIRVKEFVMKDAYSFDKDEAGLDVSYKKMFEAYKRSFDEMGIDYRIVKADTGVMGGLLSEEFQAITPIGEDTIVYCDKCHHATNLEIAKSLKDTTPSTEEHLAKELVHTPKAGTIKEVCDYLKKDEKAFVKTLIYRADDKVYGVMLRGDKEVSETKLAKALKANEIELADFACVEEVTNAKVGFAGPIALKCPIVMDEEILSMANYITGANKTDYHYINVNNEDFKADIIADITLIKEGDLCPYCHEPLKFTKGIEVGNTFKLGTKYSKALDLTYLNKDNQTEYVWMGSYGIGIGRCMAALVEQNHDENGIIWPLSVAPYKAAIVLISSKDEVQTKAAEERYDLLKNNGIETILDDREERPGVKFKDMDLIGIPYRITIGKKINEGLYELKDRRSGEVKELNKNELLDLLNRL